MPGVAQLAAVFARLAGSTPVSSPGGGKPGEPFMVATLGPDARLIVEIAWGADPGGDPNLWSWTDISGDVRTAQKVSMRVGKADEASNAQPAQCTMQLDNRAARYSLGPGSPNWPNVTRNVPLRVRVDPDGTGSVLLWQGGVTSFTPGWDASANNAIVKLLANGALRRLQQGSSPLVSTYRRAQLTTPTVVAYWPCEDGKSTTVISPGLTTHDAMTIVGSPNFESNSDFDCSDTLPVVRSAILSGRVPPYTLGSVGEQVSFLLSLPTSGIADGTQIAKISTTGTIAYWTLDYHTGGVLGVSAFTPTGTQVVSSTGLFNADGAHFRIRLSLAQSGANITWGLATLAPYAVNAGGIGSTVASQTLGVVTQVTINPQQGLGDTAIGHVVVENNNTSVFTNRNQLDAYNGEGATGRIQRLCAENGVPITFFGNTTPPADPGPGILMGPQKIDTLMNLLRQCEMEDQGAIYDGVGPGLAYVTRRHRENAPVTLALDAAAGELASDFAPIPDDQRNINQVVATRTGGAKATYTDVTGPLGTASIGTYDTSIEVNNQYDQDIRHFASWTVHKGTVEGYRYPAISMDLAHRPRLAPVWAGMLRDLGSRVDVVNIDAVLSQHPAGTLSYMVEGYQHTIDQIRWDVTLNTSPYDVWRIGTVAAELGDTSDTVLRLDTDGATLTDAVPAGSTSLSVASTGALWTTNADDFPFSIKIQDREVIVTTIASNLVPNPGFESSITWFASGGTGTQSSTQKHSGTFALRIVPDGVSVNVYGQSDLAGVKVGESVTVSAWVWFTSAVTANYSTCINWFDSNQNYLSTSSAGVSVPATTWTQVGNTFTAPSGAAYAAVVPLLVGTPPATQVFYVDDVSLTIAARQIFTVNAITTDLPAGADVALWKPRVLQL